MFNRKYRCKKTNSIHFGKIDLKSCVVLLDDGRVFRSENILDKFEIYQKESTEKPRVIEKEPVATNFLQIMSKFEW